jgi:hypothetical protein
LGKASEIQLILESNVIIKATSINIYAAETGLGGTGSGLVSSKLQEKKNFKAKKIKVKKKLKKKRCLLPIGLFPN